MTWWWWRAIDGGGAHRKRGAALAHVAARLVLIAVMDHEIEPIGVIGYQAELGHIPTHFRTVALIDQIRGNRISKWAELVVVLGGIDIWSHRHHGWILRLVHCPDRGFPRSEHRMRRNRRAAKLPVAGQAARITGDVGNEQRRIDWATGNIGARLVPRRRGRTDHWIGCGAGIGRERCHRVIRRDRTAGRLHNHAADTQCERVFVVVKDANLLRRATTAYRHLERPQHFALVKRDAGQRVGTGERVRRCARAHRVAFHDHVGR